MRIYLVLIVLFIVTVTFSVQAQDDGTPLFPADQDYFVEAFVSNETPYVGEEILYIMRYYSYTAPTGFIDVLPEFTGFWLYEVTELQSPRIETVNNRQFNVQEVYAVITPLDAGNLRVEPSVLELPETVFREAEIFESNAVEITVNPLPESESEGFVGAVGRFDMEASIDVDTVSIGQPVTLFLTIIGEGNLAQLRTPILPDLNGWRVYANSPELRTNTDAGLRLQEKTFSWLMIPDVTGTQVISPIIFSYFDPQSEVYEMLTGEAFSVEVFPAPENEQRRDIDIVLNDENIAIRAIPSQLSINSDNNDHSIWLWFLPVAVTCLLAFGVYGGDYLKRRKQQLTYNNALKNAVSALKLTHKLPTDDAFLRLKQVINQYLSDKQTFKQEKSNQSDANLQLAGVNDATISELQQCLIDSDAGRYLPEGTQIDIKPLILRTVTVLETVDGEWRI